MPSRRRSGSCARARSPSSASRSSSPSIRRCSSTRRSAWSAATCWRACILAVGVLWLFLRQFRSTLLVGIAIPISVLATVLVMLVTGHSLNVISIAGIAFAVGMTLDAATIVLESILSRRERGMRPAQAALEGATRGLARAVRLDADDGHRVPARHLHEEHRGPAVRRPRAHDLGRDRGLARHGDDRAAGRRRALAQADDRDCHAEGRRMAAPARRAHGGADRQPAPAQDHDRRLPGRARGAHLAAAAADRLPAAGQARRDRRLLPVPARHERGRDRRGSRAADGEAPRALHGGREGAAAQELLHPDLPGRRRHRRCVRSILRRSTSSAR